jgi:hypothetical protein
MTHLFTIKELRLCVIQDRRCTVIYTWQSKPALNAITVTYTLMIVVDLMGSIDFLKPIEWTNTFDQTAITVI